MAGIVDGCVLGMGNPLLDMQVTVDGSTLQKYDLKADDSILAEDKHMPLYDEVKEYPIIEYLAGGATLNTIKMIQWILDRPNACTYIGCISEDEYGQILKDECEKLKLRPRFQFSTDGAGTGKCAVLLNDKNRSMVTYLGASKELTLKHVQNPDTWCYVEKARVYYIAGYAINSCYDGVLAIAQHASENGKLFCFNLSAPFLPTFFTEQIDSIMPFVDVLFCNSEEAEAYAAKHGWDTKSIFEVARQIASYPCPSPSDKKRMVVVTRAKNPIVVAVAGEKEVRSYPVPMLASDLIVDTNGAGDALAAGFIADYLLRESVDRAIASGIKAARYIIQKSGFSLGPRGDYV
ncbi:Adenosine kinase A [Fasciola hepatica]|uniref:Adenosine kinase n=1 Tax=Fasciola hepatica TaxID=6192 RepID=A0A2H1CMI2_FASHE|nr:Adenosine kinase A [Fasciola hepatica]